MLSQLFKLVFVLVLGAVAGVLFTPSPDQRLVYMLSGMLIALTGLYLYTHWMAIGFLNWLEKSPLPDRPPSSGLWSHAADRIRRLLKSKEVLRVASEENLRQFLAAIQASPNGVILLDEESRIQWSNQTASQHLGIDPKVDLQQLIGNMVRSPGFNHYLYEKNFDQDRKSTRLNSSH